MRTRSARSNARALRLLVYVALAAFGLLGSLGLGAPLGSGNGAGAPTASAQDTAAQTSNRVTVVTVRGVINPTLAQYVTRSIDQAALDDVQAIILQLDTPGGLDSSMREIIQRILGSGTPVVVYVGPPGARAGSAGVYITYAAHIAAMAPNTNIGSATPVQMGDGGEQQMSPEMRAKVTNDAAAYIRSLAEQRGRNAEWGEKAVREGVNVTAQEARALGVVDLVAADVPDLLRQLDGRATTTATGPVTLRTANAVIQPVTMGAVDSLLHAISDPTIAYLLLSLGTMGLFFELSNPGSIFPGVVGAICLLLGFYALGALPVNYAGLLLMGLAFFLFVVDLFAPSHGILSAGGLVAFVLGSLMLFNVPDAAPWLGLSLWTVGSVTVTLAGFFLLVGRLVARSQGMKPAAGAEALIGQTGRARGALEPDGMVFVDGALWEATAQDGLVPAGGRVEVVRRDGLRLLVRGVGAPADRQGASDTATASREAASSVGAKTRP